MGDRDLEAQLLQIMQSYERVTGRCISSVTVDTEVIRKPGGGTRVSAVSIRTSAPSGSFRTQRSEDIGA